MMALGILGEDRSYRVNGMTLPSVCVCVLTAAYNAESLTEAAAFCASDGWTSGAVVSQELR